MSKEDKYFKHEWAVMKDHLRSFDKKGKQEDLHRFRVQVKKLRAFLVLEDSGDKKLKLAKGLAPVRKLFRAAGGIRDAFMHFEMVKELLTGQPEALNGQKKEIRNTTRKFRSSTGEHLKTIRKTRRKLRSSIKPLSGLHVSLYYNRQLQAIALTLSQHCPAEDLHDCRKQLKMLIYNYALVGPLNGISFDEAYLQQVQTQIGDWHDKHAAIYFFENSGNKDIEVLTALKKKRTQLKLQLTLLVKDFYTRATTVTDLPLEQID